MNLSRRDPHTADRMGTPRLSDAEWQAERRSGQVERLLTVLGPLLILALWEMLSRAEVVDPRFFPPPSRIVLRLGQMIASGDLWWHAEVSLGRIAAGFLMGALPGVILGLAIGLYRPVRALLTPLIGALMPIPTMALVPLIMILFGLGELSKWVTIATSVFFPVVINTAAGVASIDPIYIDVARNYGASRWSFFTRIALPGALPVMFEGLQMGQAIALLTIVAAEMVAASRGVGYLIWTSYKTFQIAQMFVGLLVIASLGYLFSLALRALAHRLTPWR
ncbi:taurine ABC transporter permease [Limnochorda pilosa]|uniref:Taurine ABC transporter permease n=1 Tax=Limnochorda pilosa TaxID=1555112 RepID=A0A0K2SI08_LIMPI|nr:taurine ABC transporter permease [Limnochorda pilosa]